MIQSLEPIVSRILTNLVKVFKDEPRLRVYFAIIPIGIISFAVFASLESAKKIPAEFGEAGAGVSGTIVLLTIGVLSTYQSVIEEKRIKSRIEAKEEEIRRSPEKTKAAWDLAQEKLERYLDRNLSQVRSIYWLCVMVMGFGFTLVGYGAYLIVQDPAHLNASGLSAVSGIIISFLGGSFLLIYKSTMTQAKEYVTMLERINAVGMALQIIDGLDSDNGQLKNSSKADLAKDLLKIYAQK